MTRWSILAILPLLLADPSLAAVTQPAIDGPPPTLPLHLAQPSLPREHIRELQSLLSRLGYAPGPADGVPGQRTADAIRRFERDMGVPETGDASFRVLAAAKSRAEGGAEVGPSFDCAKAGSRTEIAICSDDILTELDLNIAARYTDLRVRLSPAGRERLLADQRAWLGQRDQCADQHVCLVEMMNDRAMALVDVPRFEVPATAAPVRPGAGSLEGCTALDLTGGAGPWELTGDAPFDDVACYELLVPPGAPISVEVIRGLNVITTVADHYDARSDRQIVSSPSGRIKLLVGQLMRAIEAEPFLIRIERD